jgi:hypothetical protein
VIRFPAGEFQTGYNDEDADERVVGFAFGAPGAHHDRGEIESVLTCRECGEETGHGMSLNDAGRFDFTCLECGNRIET